MRGKTPLVLAIVIGLFMITFGSCVVMLVLPMFGVGGNQTEHAYVSFGLRPDGNLVVFSSAGGDLFTLDLSSRQVHRLTETPQVEFSPRFSRDGKTIVYSSADTSGNGMALFQMSADGSSPHKLTTDAGVSDSSAEFSPDGKSLVFSRAFRYRPYSMGGMTWDDYDVCILTLADGEVRRLTNESYYGCGGAAFVDGGQSVIFAASGHGSELASRMFKVRADGKSRPIPFMPPNGSTKGIGSWASDVAVSPDGTKLAFISDRGRPFAYDVYWADSTGSNARSLGFTKISGYNQAPAFAPDGKSVFVLAGTESNGHGRAVFSLYEIELSGKATKIADSGLFTDPTTWKPR